MPIINLMVGKMGLEISIEVDDREIDELVTKVLGELDKAEESVIRGDIRVKSIVLAEATKDPKWKYILDYYPDEERYTVVINMGLKQPRRYAVFRLSSQVVTIEELKRLLTRIAKLYLLLEKLGKVEGEKGLI